MTMNQLMKQMMMVIAWIGPDRRTGVRIEPVEEVTVGKLNRTANHVASDPSMREKSHEKPARPK
jgi:hypothetical protein